METTKDTAPITLLSDSLDIGLLNLLLTEYMVIVDTAKDGKIIYELNNKHHAGS